jgi:hypothetical protein
VRVNPPERAVSMTLLPGGVGAGFPHPALLIGVVTIVACGEGVLDAGAGEEGGEPQLAASSAQSAPKIHHKFVPPLDMLCIGAQVGSWQRCCTRAHETQHSW